MILNVTNGDSAVNLMRQANFSGDFLPWRDVLHEGPVPWLAAEEDLRALSVVRAEYIADRGWGARAAILANFEARDEMLRASARYDRIILWFEHDLYDQLQLLQLLDWFSYHPPTEGKLFLCNEDQYLGMMTPETMAGLRGREQAVTAAQRSLARQAWAAFRAATPHAWRELLDQDLGALPFLRGAVIRLLEEYPHCGHGLSRVAWHALRLVRAGETQPGRLFGRYQTTEERRFLGDSSFWWVVEDLLTASPPLLRVTAGGPWIHPPAPAHRLAITSHGAAVLAGEARVRETRERWIGGVHWTAENRWCWDGENPRVEN